MLINMILGKQQQQKKTTRKITVVVSKPDRHVPNFVNLVGYKSPRKLGPLIGIISGLKLFWMIRLVGT
jgi:hypothetical protein